MSNIRFNDKSEITSITGAEFIPITDGTNDYKAEVQKLAEYTVSAITIGSSSIKSLISTNSANISTLSIDVFALETSVGTTSLTTSSQVVRTAINELEASTRILNLAYSQKNFIVQSTTSSIVIKANTKIVLNVVGESNPRLFSLSTDTVYTLSTILDTGSVSAGKDYCIYLVAGTGTSVNVVASLNSTYPTGYTANNSRKIGGLHTLCVSVTSGNAPALVDTDIWVTHPAIGYNAGDIIPNSVWCLAHRPISDPSGMVYVDKIDKWIDIYLQSGFGLNTASAYGATVKDTRTQIQHQWDMELKNKKLATDNDFTMFAEGSNQKTAIFGSAPPSPKTSGGHLDTSSKRMISGYFIEECCGYLWQWIDEIAPVGGSGFVSYGDETTRGATYGMPYCLLAGGHWGDSSSCGSRSRAANTGRSAADAIFGGRGSSLPLII